MPEGSYEFGPEDVAQEPAPAPDVEPAPAPEPEPEPAAPAAQVQAQLEEARQAAAAAQARIAELETKLAAPPATAGPQLTPKPLDPALLADDEASIDRRDAQLAELEQWALDNWEGSDDLPATATSPAQPAATAKQVRSMYQRVQEARSRLIPAARTALAQRRQHEAQARSIYPALFDPKTPEHRVAQALLAQAPALKAVFPNIYTIIGDAIAGERARLARAQAKPAPTAPKVTTRPAPAAPVKPAAAGKPAGEAGISAARFMELKKANHGNDREALEAMLTPLVQ